MKSVVNHIVAGLLRNADGILLVQQQGKDDPAPTWSFPGGMVEDGELLSEALVREFREETGFEIKGVGKLAYVTQMDNPIEETQTFAFIFEVTTWQGSLSPKDPDGVILQAEFLPLQEAVRCIKRLPWRAMREPAVGWLSGEVPPGKVWLYRLGADGQEDRIDF